MSTFSKTVIVDPSAEGYPHTIQEGVSSLSGQGGTVYVEAGEYVIDSLSDTVTIPSDTTIIGRGNVIVNVTEYNISAFTNSTPSTGNEHITISGFKIIVECNTNPYNKHLVDFRNVKNCIIEKLTITCTGTQGIYQYVKKNDQDPTREDQWAAILLYSSGENYTCINNIVRQCYIYDYGKYFPPVGQVEEKVYYGFGICLSGIACRNNIIKNNYISGCLDGIFLMDTSNNIVANNIFTSSAGHYPAGVGVLVQNCDSTIISGNQITDNRDHGIYLSGCRKTVVRGNVVSDNHDQGIHVRFAGKTEPFVKDEYNCIVGNVLYHNDGRDAPPVSHEKGCGIQMQGYADWNSIFGNVCAKNTATGIRVQTEKYEQYNPQKIYPSKNNIVSGNVVVHNDDNPQISIDDASNISADNKTIQC